MTVTYSLDVASSSFFCLYKLLWRWKGSIWKAIWIELTLWLTCYAILSITYRFLLNKEQKYTFEDIVIFFNIYSDYIPLTFILGFYVTAVFNRWWSMFMSIGWIDTPALWIAQYIVGSSPRARMLRRNMIRYCVLTQAMVFRDIAASLMTEAEIKEFDSIESKHAKYWQPMHWLFSLVRKAKEEMFIPGEIIYIDLMEKLRQFRVDILSLTLYDWVPVPLVYTQVVHLAVRSYFVIALFGRQYINVSRDVSSSGFNKTIDMYVPIMSVLQFIFYVGWMKVAECILNPFGEDDDDFEMNWLLDRNLQVGLLIVDTAYGHYPEITKDPFWTEKDPTPLYTAESALRPMNPQVGSCAQLETEEEPFMLNPRRRTVKRTEEWDGEVDENDIVPVLGLSQRRKEGGSNASGESLAFSQSFMSQSRRLSDMFKRLRGRRASESKFNSGFDLSRRSRVHRMSETPTQMDYGDTPIPMPTEEFSRQDSELSVNPFGESIAYEMPPHSPTTMHHHNGRILYSPDGMKIREKDKDDQSDTKENDEFPHSPRISHVPMNSWYENEMLPSIQEEDAEKKRTSETDSLRSHNSTLNSKNAMELTKKLSKNDSRTSAASLRQQSSMDKEDDTKRPSLRRKRSTHTQRELDEQEREPTDSEEDDTQTRMPRSRKSSVRSMSFDRNEPSSSERRVANKKDKPPQPPDDDDFHHPQNR